MSHFSAIKTQMTNVTAIVAALQELGYTAEIHEPATYLRSIYQGNRYQQANIVVRRETIKSYTPQQIEDLRQRNISEDFLAKAQEATIQVDFGLLRQEDGSYAIVSDPMYSAVQHITENLNHLYAKHTVLEKARQLGDSVTVTERIENGQFVGWKLVIEKHLETTWTSASTDSSSTLYQTY